jgi:hypothetical protein
MPPKIASWGGADKNLDYLEVVHVFLGKPHSSSQARKRYRCNHSAFGLPDVYICFKLRRCFRDFVASIPSQVASFSAYGSSLLELTRLAYMGSVSSDLQYFFRVLRVTPVRLEISRMDMLYRNAQRLMTFNVGAAYHAYPWAWICANSARPLRRACLALWASVRNA